MPETGPPTRGAVQALATEVAGLKSAYENYQKLVKFLIGLTVALIVLGVWLFTVAQSAEKAALESKQAASAAQKAIDAIEKSGITNCQNNNESRKNTRTLWQFLLGTSSPDDTPEKKAAKEAIISWINVVYGERDCSQPNKKYELPPPPDLSKILNHKG